MKVSRQYVSELLKANNIQPPTRVTKTMVLNLHIDQIRSERDSGINLKELALKYGTNPNAICQLLKVV